MFSLTWEKFSSNILKTFKDIKKSGHLHDVTLVCADGEINAHKLVLYGGSNFFQSVLAKSIHQHPLIYLKGIKMKYLQAIIDFIYNGEVEIAEEDLNILLETAEDLEINGLVQKETMKDIKDVADSKELFARDTDDELMDQYVDLAKIKSENYKVVKKEENPNEIMSTEEMDRGENDNDIELLSILDKFKNLESDETLELMEKVSDPDGTRVWKCILCDKSNNDKTRIRKHVRAQHLKKTAPSQEKTPYYISFKDSLEDFATDEEFQRKVLSLMEKSMGDDQKVTWSCIKCKKSNGDKSRIKKHVEKHINNLIFTCIFCEERRSRGTYMKKHIALKHTRSA